MSIPLANFTTYLGYLVKSNEGSNLRGRPMNKSKLQINPLITKEILGKYEAILTTCCYFSRLNYEIRTRKVLSMYNILDYSPLVFNKALSYLTYSKSKDEKIEVNPAAKKVSGYLLYDPVQDTPVSITIKTVLGEKMLFVSFRGTISIRTLLKDLNISYRNLFDLYGNELFSEEYSNVQSRGKSLVNPFGAHNGFVSGLINIYPILIKRILGLLTENTDIKRVFVTGHSLGGAYANLFGMALGQMKKKGVPIPDLHIVTFGAPKTFTDYSRNVFNKLLLENIMTLDRVTNRPRFPDPTMITYDPVPLIPQNLDHPGFMILKPEIKTQSRTGRTKHISELRNELSNIKAKKSLFSALISRNYNPLPDYAEFYSKFKDSSFLTVDEYSKLLSTTPAGTVRFSSGPAAKVIEIVKKLFNISNEEILQVEKLADVETNKEIADYKSQPLTVPQEVIEDVKNTSIIVDKAYENTGGPPIGPPIGGGRNTNIYKTQTIVQQPNHVVYSCSQITAPIPFAGCHLGYLGVGWIGAALNAGSGTATWRGYNREAVLYETNNIWTFVSDIQPLAKLNKQVAGRKTRRNIRSKSKLRS